VIQDNKQTEWENLVNDGWMVEIDEGDGLAWPWPCCSIRETEKKAKIRLLLTMLDQFFFCNKRVFVACRC